MKIIDMFFTVKPIHGFLISSMIKIILIIITPSIFVVINSCSDIVLESQPQINPLELIWKSDTLSYPESLQTSMTSIWGSSPNDVWVCGHNDRSQGNLWHYNGMEWEAVDLFKDIFRSPNSLFKVYGFSPNDVWVVGARILDEYYPQIKTINKSLVLHYDGFKWTEHNFFINGWVNDVWGKNSRDIWVTGWGIVGNYNGSSWRSDTLKYISSDGTFQLNDYRETPTGKYMMGIKLINGFADNMYYFFKYADNNWGVVDSFRFNSPTSPFKFGFKQYLAGDGTLYSMSIEGIYELKKGTWSKLKSTFSKINGMIKLGSQKILAVGDFGQALYYDGNNWQQINELNNTNIFYGGIWSDGKEIFIIGITLGSTPQRTIIWHGK